MSLSECTVLGHHTVTVDCPLVLGCANVPDRQMSNGDVQIAFPLLVLFPRRGHQKNVERSKHVSECACAPQECALRMHPRNA
eukprot:1158077-Pelagomonas_calceolata.AAC.7